MTAMPTFDPGFSTPEMTAIFSPERRVESMLSVEAALARAQASLGIIPSDVARRIEEACSSATVDGVELALAGWESGTPLIPLLADLRSRLDDEAASWLHHGATTQDIVDTGAILQMRDGLAAVSRCLSRAGANLKPLLETHRHTPIAGRTFLQPGAATSFGLIAAGWFANLDDHRHSLDDIRASLPVQLGGPVGDLAAFGARGPEMMAELARELGLVAPRLPWHANRTPIVTVIAELDATATALAKIAGDVILLAGYGELRTRPGRSSSMPQKANPIDAVHAVAAAVACSGAASVVTPGHGHELQRAAGRWHAEWWAIPMTFHCLAAATAALERCVESIEVDADRMMENLDGAGLDGVVPDSAAALIDGALGRHTEAGA